MPGACEAWLRQAVLADLPRDRRLSYLFFALALAISLATTQSTGPVKTAIFLNVVGTEKEPIAKTFVLVVLLPLLVFYSILISTLPSSRVLVLVVCGAYMGVFLLITVLHAAEHGNPAPWVAWLLYFAAETRGVIVMPMIWSVVADVSTSDLSKKAYPFLFFGIQIGGIIGSYCAIRVSSLGGEVGLLILQTVSFIVVAAFTWLACGVLDDSSADERLAITSTSNVEQGGPPEQATESKSLAAVSSEKLQEGFAGLWLLASRPYAMMAFWVSYAYLVPRTVLDYENSVLATYAFADDRNEQVAFFGKVNMIVNVSVALISLLATRELVHFCGVRYMLFLLPIVMVLCILMLCAHYSLMTSTVGVVVASTVAYAVNSPCKEMLFVRTSRDIKFKAKSWSEMYGNQLMKMLGAQINLWINNESAVCHPTCFQPGITGTVSLMWVGAWLLIANEVGSTYTRLDKEDKIVS